MTGVAQRRADSADRAYTAIRKLVVDFRLRPQERVNEMHLARELGLSRTPVREALNRLASEGFLVFVPNRGFFFRALEIDDLVWLFELRTIVEVGSFQLACERATSEQIATMHSFWNDARRRYEKRDHDEILELDEAFHVKLAGLSNNPEIVRHLTWINARIRFIRRVQIEHGPHHSAMIDEHTRLIEAVANRDAATGIRLLREHISMTVEDARGALKEALFSLYLSETRSAGRRPARSA